MSLTVRKSPAALAIATAQAFNAFVRAYIVAETTFPHYDITSTPGGDFQNPTSTALAVANTGTADLPAVIVMAERARVVLLTHFADAVAHTEADADNAALISYDTIPALTSTSSQADTDTLVNALATALTAHEADTDVHPTADGTNAITAPSATNLATSKVRVADVRVQTNAHILLGWPSPSLTLIPD